MGNGLRGSPRLRSLWIINIHSRRWGQAGRDSHSSTQPSVQTVTEPVSTVGVKLRSPTQIHTHAHKLGTCMDDLPYLNTDCDECESAERPAHAKHAHHFAAVVSRRRGCVGSHLCTQLHFLRAATDPLTLWRTIWTAGGGNGLRSGFMCFHVKASCRINQKVEERWFRGNARLFLQPLLF